MQLGHISTNPITTGTTDIMREIEDIQSVLKYSKRALDLITLAMPNNTAEWSYNQIQEILEQVQATTNTSSGSSIGNSSLQVGLDLNTKILSECTQKDVDYLIQTILQPLADRNILSTLTVACNAYTYQNTNTIFNWIHQYNTTNSTTNTTNSSPKITSFATELLRTHSHRPGLLSSGYSHTMPHRMAVSEQKDDNTSNTPATTTKTTIEGVVYSKTMSSMVGKVQVAVEDFKMALDRCMHAEKIFLSKVSGWSLLSLHRRSGCCCLYIYIYIYTTRYVSVHTILQYIHCIYANIMHTCTLIYIMYIFTKVNLLYLVYTYM